MTKRFYNLFLVFTSLSSVVFYSSCNKTDTEVPFDCERIDLYDATYAQYGIRPMDTLTDSGILDAVNYCRYRDSIRVYNDLGIAATDFSLDRAGKVWFTFIDARLEDLSPAYFLPQTKIYYLYINHKVVDTIRIDYMLYNENCDYSTFRYLNAYYNGEQTHTLEFSLDLFSRSIPRDSLAYNPCTY